MRAGVLCAHDCASLSLYVCISMLQMLPGLFLAVWPPGCGRAVCRQVCFCVSAASAAPAGYFQPSLSRVCVHDWPWPSILKHCTCVVPLPLAVAVCARAYGHASLALTLPPSSSESDCGLCLRRGPLGSVPKNPAKACDSAFPLHACVCVCMIRMIQVRATRHPSASPTL